MSMYFRNYLPLGKGGALHLNKLKSNSPNDMYFVPSLVEIGPVVLEKNLKSLLTDERQITGEQKSSLELSSQVS